MPTQSKQQNIEESIEEKTGNFIRSIAKHTEKEKKSGIEKICLICKKLKDCSEFYPVKRRGKIDPDAYCKPCRKRRNKRWNRKNKRKRNEAQQKWRMNNPELNRQIQNRAQKKRREKIHG